MDPRTLAQALAAGRVALGLAMFLAPAQATRQWLGWDASLPATKTAVRGLGARDVALGIGTLAAMRHEDGGAAGHWIEGAIVADGADAVASLLSKGPLGGRLLGLSVASGAAAAGLWLRQRLP